MRNVNKTIRKLVSMLNDIEEDGGFWLPNIQRSFVWTEDQICRLFDSILREYPISTLLVWKTKSSIRHRKFIDNWSETLSLSSFFVPSNDRKKYLVLDGQQRLQSLYIGLRGSYEGKELYFDTLSGEIAAPDDIKYRFEFRNPSDAEFPWVRLKDVVDSNRRQREIAKVITSSSGRTLTHAEHSKVDDHVELLRKTFVVDEGVTYQELDSVDNPDLYTDDDIVEVFIRANSGGTKLGKSDLLFSLLAASWDVAADEMEILLSELNRHGFEFDRDFVLKTCLVLLDQGSRYEVAKFRKSGVRDDIEARWPHIGDAIRDVLDFVRSKTFIRCDRALPSYLVLIPLVYLRYKMPEKWNSAKGMETYLLRASLAGAFGGQPDNLIDALVKKIIEDGGFDLANILNVIVDQRRSLEITEDRLWAMGYGSNTLYLLFNIWYERFNYTPAYENNLPQVDHIFPRSLLKTVKVKNPETERLVLKYPEAQRDQLANCALLTRQENGMGGKGDTPPAEWFADKTPDYLDMHLIPGDPRLWELDAFEEFITERKNLIRAKLRNLIAERVG